LWRGRRKNGTISIRRHGQEGKGNISVTIEELLRYGDQKKDIKAFTV
jgi:threonyl-tRNA synthetase